MRVWLTSGKFESSIAIPLNYTEEQQKEFVLAWFDLMRTGVRLGAKL